MAIKRQKIKEKIQAKRRKTFRRCECWRYTRLKEKWRKPRGIEQKMRIYHRGSKGGHQVSPTTGYRTSRLIRGLHPSGYKMMLVSNVKDLEDLKPKYHAIMISAKVGRRKRLSLKDEILVRGFTLLNPGIEEEYGLELEGAEEDLDLSDVDLSTGEIDEDLEITSDDLEDVEFEESEDEENDDEEESD
ncbi:MAG: eL32 family ribosomal protein [Promethearchaeota archaeon]